MVTKLAINGFGRIGRNILRALFESGRNDVEIVAINELTPLEMQAHLLRFDSVHGRFDQPVEVADGGLRIGDRFIRSSSERDPEKLPWADVDIALECTGLFTDRDAAARHLQNGSSRVLVSAPSKGADKTIVYGVNHKSLSATDLVVSNGSCTTNCLAPVAMVLHQHLGIKKGYMTTIHSYTGDQPTLDANHSDPLPGSRRRTLHGANLYRRCEGSGAGSAGARRQARRISDTRPDTQRLGGRPVVTDLTAYRSGSRQSYSV